MGITDLSTLERNTSEQKSRLFSAQGLLWKEGLGLEKDKDLKASQAFSLASGVSAKLNYLLELILLSNMVPFFTPSSFDCLIFMELFFEKAVPFFRLS